MHTKTVLTLLLITYANARVIRQRLPLSLPASTIIDIPIGLDLACGCSQPITCGCFNQLEFPTCTCYPSIVEMPVATCFSPIELPNTVTYINPVEVLPVEVASFSPIMDRKCVCANAIELPSYSYNPIQLQPIAYYAPELSCGCQSVEIPRLIGVDALGCSNCGSVVDVYIPEVNQKEVAVSYVAPIDVSYNCFNPAVEVVTCGCSSCSLASASPAINIGSHMRHVNLPPPFL